MQRRGSVALTMICQEADFWCWASVVQTVESHFGTVVAQATIATDHVSRHVAGAVCAAADAPDANFGCGASCVGACNSPHALSVIWAERRPTTITRSNSPSFADITRLIDAGRPVPVRIEWAPNSGHFICIVGYADDGQGNLFVEVRDPFLPGINAGPADLRRLSFAVFTTGYSLNGQTGTPSHFYEV